MRATGIIRRIDDLGRVIIPKEIRRTMQLREGDPIEFFISEDGALALIPYRCTLAEEVRAIKDKVAYELNTGRSVTESEIISALEKAMNLLDKLGKEGEIR